MATSIELIAVPTTTASAEDVLYTALAPLGAQGLALAANMASLTEGVEAQRWTNVYLRLFPESFTGYKAA